MKTYEEILNIVNPLDDVLSDSSSYHVSLSRLEEQLKSLNQIMPLELDADFQRTYVWTTEQKIAFVENLLRRKVKSASILFNQYGYNLSLDQLNQIDSDIAGKFICVDGKQRLSACLDFVQGKLALFDGQLTYADLMSNQKIKLRILEHRFAHLRFCFLNFESKRDLLNFYLELNSGGTVHSEQDLNKVKEILARLP